MSERSAGSLHTVRKLGLFLVALAPALCCWIMPVAILVAVKTLAGSGLAISASAGTGFAASGAVAPCVCIGHVTCPP